MVLSSGNSQPACGARVSVIIPALNEQASIARAVESAIRSGADEVIVCDGGSNDQTVALAQMAGAIVVNAPPGRASQQNAGADQAQGDFLLFLHADSRIDARAVQELRQRGGFAGGFRQRIDAPGVLLRIIERGNDLRARLLGLPYGDQALYFRASWFRDIGGFPDVPIMEDYILMRTTRWRHWPKMLRSVTTTSVRRWQNRGVLRQTLLNWSLIVGYELGFSLAVLARFYVRHDRQGSKLQEAHADR